MVLPILVWRIISNRYGRHNRYMHSRPAIRSPKSRLEQRGWKVWKEDFLLAAGRVTLLMRTFP